jgi:hypothetical protein
MDVCYKVLNDDENDVLVDAWNMGQTSAYPIGETFTLVKNLLDKKWFVCDNDKYILDNNLSFSEAKWTRLGT